MSDDLRDLWTTPDPQEEPMIAIDTAALRREAAAFDRTISQRNLRETLAAGVVIAAFSAIALHAAGAGELLRAASAASVAVGGLFVGGYLYTHGTPPPAEPATSTADYLSQRRQALVYQADLLDRVPYWYIAPTLPGLLGMTLAQAGDTHPGSVAVGLAGLCLILGGIIWLNRRAARELRAEADALPSLD